MDSLEWQGKAIQQVETEPGQDKSINTQLGLTFLQLFMDYICKTS